MHGSLRQGEQSSHRRHMWSVPAPSSSSSVAATTDYASVPPDYFSKDGRKIHVGDCALFKPPQDSPPFIGIIRRLIFGKEDNLSLCVNWLYRPADIKLGKGILLEAAPNEVFYSFHKDEIPAVSLLHPCKVAFLRKGVELPSGISAFVCRRVYDIESKCLWWLTDQDYINKRQEEVDQLLDKTRLEMYGAVQSGGRSPKALNVPTGTLQSKPGTDSVYNSSSSFPSQVKGKKRERGDQGSDPVKRERSVKADDTDFDRFRPEQMIKSEIVKITDKGGLVDSEGVEKLVQLMKPEGADKKIDLACRIMLVDVLAATDRFDCLGRFVQLKGLPVLDEWLQEVHKGKIGDGNTPRECDRLTEEFLLALLRALDKLPVNLHALQTCNVGKSVNNLRTYKNPEIQKKARSLVDTWKKRVEAEMNIIDAKSGTNRGGPWPPKSVISEVSHVGTRRIGSSDSVVKSSMIQSSTPVKLGSGEDVAKYSTASPGSAKLPESVTTSGGSSIKDLISTTLVGGGTTDLQLTMIKEEKSSNSSQSQNNSPSCSSDHARSGASCREDARSSTAGSVSVSKISSGVSRSRKLSNGLHGSGASVVQKETRSVKYSSLHRNTVSEKSLPTRVTCEREPNVPPVDNGNNQRLIVRLPNTGRSPACSSSGGSPDDPSSTFCKASPPADSDKLDYHDQKVKVKSDAQRTTSLSNTKDGLPGSEEVNASSAGAICDGLSRDGEDSEKLMESSKATCLSSQVTPKAGKSYEAAFSSINALIESCVKFSEAAASASVGDDIGMNLLASVAAGEISRADVSPLGSPGRRSPAPEDSCAGNDGKLRQLDEDRSHSEKQPNYGENVGAMADQVNSVDSLSGLPRNPTTVLSNFSKVSKVASFGCEEKTGECAAQLNLSSMDLPQNVDGTVLNSDGKARSNTTSISKLKTKGYLVDEDGNIHYADENATENSVVMAPEAAPASEKVEKEADDESPYCSSSEVSGKDKIVENRKTVSCDLVDQKPLHVIGGKSEETASPSGSCNVLDVELKAEKDDELKAGNNTVQREKENLEIGSFMVDHGSECAQGDSERKEVLGQCPAGSASHEESPAIPVQETDEGMKSSGCQLDGTEADGAEGPAARANASSFSVVGSDAAVMLDFDLNEGFPVDDGIQGEHVKSAVPENSSSVHLPCPLPIPISTMAGSFPASITVAAAAKGPFVPPENPLRNKGELGWKGSAATSAFRPAEPRKVLEMPLNTTDAILVDNCTSKQGRPFLDFDLNVPDQRVLEDLASQNSGRLTCLESGSRDHSGGGLDLDLNRADESHGIGQSLISNSCRLEISQFPGMSPLSAGFANAELNAARGFDLNDGPGPDEVSTDAAPLAKNTMPFLSTVPAIRMNNTELGNISSWFPPSNSYSALAFPSMLPGRGEQSYPLVPAAASQRVLGPPSGGTPFNPEIYRGPVLSSSPAAGFLPATPFQYSGFPFETNFPPSSNSYSACSAAYVDSSTGGPLCFPNIPTQLVGPTGMLSTHYPRPYFMSLPGGPSNASAEGRKFGIQGLDLNAGPGGTDVERRDDRLTSALRQLPFAGSQSLADEQLKLYQMAGGVLKRKEPDGGWDGDRINYKHCSWQ
ncbi:unnamed protein product [Ilex paraguariensis]|uniref:Uncharacterized protein n=1 Tax=Ilex paraguariensis TaxID=185542 RepID=A0ABC8SWI2_9AQUA